MNINSLYSTVGATPVTDVGNVTSSSSSTAASPSVGDAGTATFSTPAQFFSSLNELSQQDPAKFKAVASQLATSFQNAASQATGPQAKILTNLANQLSQASQTGSLQPPQGGPTGAQQNAPAQSTSGGEHHPHHHHHGGGSATASGSSGELAQAMQNAMGILTQVLQSSDPSSSATSASATAST